MNKAIIITLLALIASIGLASAIVVYQENPSTTPVVTWVGDGGYIDKLLLLMLSRLMRLGLIML